MHLDILNKRIDGGGPENSGEVAAVDRYTGIVQWVVFGAATAPIWGAVLWELWQGVVRPRLIPREEVEQIATMLLARYGDLAEHIAFAKEYAAWCHSDGFEQGKWRRVRRHIRDRCR
jgi:hypothetical protein